MDLFEINRETCNRDGICAAVCPTGIIEFDNGDFPTASTDANELCLRCGHCVAVCPTGSFHHRDIPLEKSPLLDKDLHLTEKHCEGLLQKRRSIRIYKDEPVSKEKIERLIELAKYAPSGHNSQGVEWLVLGDRDELKYLSGIVADCIQWMLEKRPEYALSMHLDRTLERWKNGTDVFLRNAPALIIAHAKQKNVMSLSSCTIALTYIELVAPNLDLGCCWAGYFNMAATVFPPMLKALSLPEGQQCFGALMAGYPKYRYKRTPLRKTPKITWRL